MGKQPKAHYFLHSAKLTQFYPKGFLQQLRGLFSFLKFIASFTVSDHLPFPQLSVFFREVVIGSQTMTAQQRFIAKT